LQFFNITVKLFRIAAKCIRNLVFYYNFVKISFHIIVISIFLYVSCMW